jgi:hypothetical protein
MLNVTLILQTTPDPAQIQHIVMAMMAILPVIILVFLAIVITPYWFIWPWLSLLNVIPLGNLVLIYVLAFSDWKVIPAPQAYWQPQQPYPPPPPTFPPQT